MTTKGSHFIPRTYLKHFLEDDSLFMYKKGKKFFSQGMSKEDRIVEIKTSEGLNRIAKENHIYTINISGIEPDFMEGILKELGEDEYNNIISDIERMSRSEYIDNNIHRTL